ncbi:acyl-CoA dehydrogenase family protein [Gordonia polyisoprenivorans]|uniref:acyl-CoA dehydrogenase family protein n=1 Tax=Gordonia polyisoprenivorans TaxID=84595 RepID=UPI001AD6191F|nr:acyl-CoA dehydrogenase family protein [Gordonia polyisoprenivorans]QTI70943.1 acyl-CoA/acyl-ACP dehydrogenase [Gordonia polyisoprenivorans]
MDFALDDDQIMLQEVLRTFFGSQVPDSAVRARFDEPTGYDVRLWKRMAEELGLQGLAIPEEYGGGGFSFFELGLVLEEMGRVLLPSPFLGSCVMSAQLLLAIDDEAARGRLLPGIADGSVIVSVAFAEESGSWSTRDVTATATSDGDGWRIDGRKSYVLDGHAADSYLVIARASDGVGVFEVGGTAVGLTRTKSATMDLTRALAKVTFNSVPARRIGSAAATETAIEVMLDHTRIALAADSLGGIGRVLDMAVEYAKTREQFGRKIGSFQAIKHKCASMLMELEASRSAVYYALWAAAKGQADRPVVAPMVKAHCMDSYLAAAGENIQIHGGIGFTWEHPAHLYLKHARSSQALLGDSDLHRQILADRIGV